MLDSVAAGVHVLKEMAEEMGKVHISSLNCNTNTYQEVESQGVMLDNLDVKVDKVNDQLENVNLRLKKVLDNVCLLPHLLLANFCCRCGKRIALLLILFF